MKITLKIARIMTKRIFKGIKMIVKSNLKKTDTPIKSGNKTNTMTMKANRKKIITPIMVQPTLLFYENSV